MFSSFKSKSIMDFILLRVSGSTRRLASLVTNLFIDALKMWMFNPCLWNNWLKWVKNWTAFDWKSSAISSNEFLRNSSSLSNLLSLKLYDKKYAFNLGSMCNILSMWRSKESQCKDTCFKIDLCSWSQNQKCSANLLFL